MARKFIINDGIIIMGNVEYHNELHGKNRDSSKTIGGGRWQWDKVQKKVYFYGKSKEFNGVRKEAFIEALSNSFLSAHFENHQLVFSYEEHFSDVIKEGNEYTFVIDENYQP